ncbi:unnamed protein product [Sphacelaria rigidula]
MQVARAAAIAQRHAADREREVYLHAKREAERAERDCHAETEVLEELSLERVEQEASRASAAHDKMAVEASVAIKMESHHRARANDRGQARRELREKAHAQV